MHIDMHKLRCWIRRENIKRIPWGVTLKEDNAFAKTLMENWIGNIWVICKYFFSKRYLMWILTKILSIYLAAVERSSSKTLNVLDVKLYFCSSASRAIKFIDEETFVMDFNLNTRKLFVNVLNCFLRQNFCVSNFFHFVQKRYWWIFH